MQKLVIAIDGPSAAGKSTVGKMLAKKLNYIYIDTGAMYRAIALKLQRNDISLDDLSNIENILKHSTINFIRKNDELRIILDGEDVSPEIRTPLISKMASDASAVPIVRTCLVKMQQEMGEAGGVVMDGRDIGTVVFPGAECKFFLDASLDERARRRFKELQEQGLAVEFSQVRREMEQRDHNDSTRAHSPLRKAVDAISIDTTDLELEAVIQKMWDLIISRYGIRI
ncbi:MAG: (d)CMP kinase [Candidatus Schekmanbacteria bacterium]|nr:(d)CMP kinase [Candidatus Schekmanbacteria bacterium]